MDDQIAVLLACFLVRDHNGQVVGSCAVGPAVLHKAAAGSFIRRCVRVGCAGCIHGIRGNHFLHGIAEGLSDILLRVLDRVEGRQTVRIIRFGLYNLAVRIAEGEGELPFRYLCAGGLCCLLRGKRNLAGCLVQVVDHALLHDLIADLVFAAYRKASVCRAVHVHRRMHDRRVIGIAVQLPGASLLLCIRSFAVGLSERLITGVIRDHLVHVVVKDAFLIHGELTEGHSGTVCRDRLQQMLLRIEQILRGILQPVTEAVSGRQSAIQLFCDLQQDRPALLLNVHELRVVRHYIGADLRTRSGYLKSTILIVRHLNGKGPHGFVIDDPVLYQEALAVTDRFLGNILTDVVDKGLTCILDIENDLVKESSALLVILRAVDLGTRSILQDECEITGLYLTTHKRLGSHHPIRPIRIVLIDKRLRVFTFRRAVGHSGDKRATSIVPHLYFSLDLMTVIGDAVLCPEVLCLLLVCRFPVGQSARIHRVIRNDLADLVGEILVRIVVILVLVVPDAVKQDLLAAVFLLIQLRSICVIKPEGELVLIRFPAGQPLGHNQTRITGNRIAVRKDSLLQRLIFLIDPLYLKRPILVVCHGNRHIGRMPVIGDAVQSIGIVSSRYSRRRDIFLDGIMPGLRLRPAKILHGELDGTKVNISFRIIRNRRLIRQLSAVEGRDRKGELSFRQFMALIFLERLEVRRSRGLVFVGEKRLLDGIDGTHCLQLAVTLVGHIDPHLHHMAVIGDAILLPGACLLFLLCGLCIGLVEVSIFCILRDLLLDRVVEGFGALTIRIQMCISQIRKIIPDLIKDHGSFGTICHLLLQDFSCLVLQDKGEFPRRCRLPVQALARAERDRAGGFIDVVEKSCSVLFRRSFLILIHDVRAERAVALVSERYAHLRLMAVIGEAA